MIVATPKTPPPMPTIGPTDRLAFPVGEPGTVSGVLVERGGGSGLGMSPATKPAIVFATSPALEGHEVGDVVTVTGAPDGGFSSDDSLFWSAAKVQAYTGTAVLTPQPQGTVGTGPAPVTVHFVDGEQVPGATDVSPPTAAVTVS